MGRSPNVDPGIFMGTCGTETLPLSLKPSAGTLC